MESRHRISNNMKRLSEMIKLQSWQNQTMKKEKKPQVIAAVNSLQTILSLFTYRRWTMSAIPNSKEQKKAAFITSSGSSIVENNRMSTFLNKWLIKKAPRQMILQGAWRYIMWFSRQCRLPVHSRGNQACGFLFTGVIGRLINAAVF